MPATSISSTNSAHPEVSFSPAEQNGSAANSSLGTTKKVSASEIDRRRAAQLLDRAFILFSQGDSNNAILSCRQGINLAPQWAPTYSLLGLMLERRGNITEAIDAYEKVISLAPDSALERDSLQRLRATHSQNGKVSGRAAGFVFDEAELFEDISLAARSDAAVNPLDVPIAPVPVIPTPAVATPVVATPVVPTPVVTVPPAATAVAATAAGQVAASSIPAPNPSVVSGNAGVSSVRQPGKKRLGNVPAANELSAPSPVAAPSSMPSPTVPAATSPFDAPVVVVSPSNGPVAGWQSLLTRPSYFYRGIPLLVAALLSLLFLGWAQHRASIRHQSSAQVEETRVSNLPTLEDAPSDTPPVDTQAAPVADPKLPTGPQGDNPGSPFTIGNAPASPQGTPAPGASQNSAVNGSRPTRANNNSSSASPRRNRSSGSSPRRATENSVPPFPVPAFPAPATGASPPVAPANPSAGVPSFPFAMPPLFAPRSRPRSSEPTRGIPVDEEASPAAPSSGAASGGRGIIRIVPENPSPASAPPRASARARAAELQAGRAARTGNASAALSQLNEALRAGGGTGWNYQQKGLIQLQNGEYERAVDSFRTAIQGYSEQIARGEAAAAARSGIQTCRSGIRMAQAQIR